MSDIVERLSIKSDPDSRDAVTEIVRLRAVLQRIVDDGLAVEKGKESLLSKRPK